MKSESEIRREIVEAVRRLEELGLNHASSGNISHRFGERTLITPTGAHTANLTEARIVSIDDEGKASAEGGVPSSEWRMHTEILKAHPEAQAVVHTHADTCVALSCLRRPIPPFHYMVAFFGGDDIPCARYATFGSDALAHEAVAALAERSACLLANHGMITFGPTLEHAVGATIRLETLARQYVIAKQAGEPVLLSKDDMAVVIERYRRYGVGHMPRA